MIFVSSSEMSEVSLVVVVADDLEGRAASTSSGFKPSLARSLFVSSMESESPRPPSGIGEADFIRGGGGHLGGFVSVGRCCLDLSVGRSTGTSTQSEPERGRWARIEFMGLG